MESHVVERLQLSVTRLTACVLGLGKDAMCAPTLLWCSHHSTILYKFNIGSRHCLHRYGKLGLGLGKLNRKQ